MRFTPILVIIASIFIYSCETTSAQQNGPGYWDLPTTHRMPANEQERQEECARIRQEMARVQSWVDGGIRMFTMPQQQALIIQRGNQNMAALENRAAQVGCTKAFTDAPASKELSFDACFEKCKKYTTRTNEECFDSCNK